MLRILFLIGLLSVPAFAAVKVVTTTTDLAWMVQQVGGELVEVKPLLRGKENPHYVDTLPSYISAVADARVVCLVGLDLEVGWMPKVLAKSGNAKVQPGGDGYCEVAKAVQVLEKPTGAIDRSMGDVHPGGNPHFWLSPTHLAQAAREVTLVLSKVDPENGSKYARQLQLFTARMQKLRDTNLAILKPLVAKLTAPAVVEYHKEFSYFLEVYGLKSLGSIEEKPGIPPSAGRIAEFALAAKNAGVKLVLAAEYSPKKTIQKFVEISKLPVVTTATSLPGDALDYEKLQNTLVGNIAAVLK